MQIYEQNTQFQVQNQNNNLMMQPDLKSQMNVQSNFGTSQIQQSNMQDLQQQIQFLNLQNQQLQFNQIKPQTKEQILENKAQMYIQGGLNQCRSRRIGSVVSINCKRLSEIAKEIIEQTDFTVKGVQFQNSCFSLCGNHTEIIEKQVIEKLKQENTNLSENDTVIRESAILKCVYALLPKIQEVLKTSCIISSILTIFTILSFVFRTQALNDTSDPNYCNGEKYCYINENQGTVNLEKQLILIQTIVITVCFLGHLLTYILNNPIIVNLLNFIYILNYVLTMATLGLGMSFTFDLEGFQFFIWNMISFVFILGFSIFLLAYNSTLSIQMKKLYIITGQISPDVLL